MLPLIVLIHPHMSFFLLPKGKKTEIKIPLSLGMKFCPRPPFIKRERWIDAFIGSVGTDGARTRSFRLDRAVLWPIELQSQGNKGSSRKFDSFLSPYQIFLKDKGVIAPHSRLANYWAELDLNQRRHIANEFTVRPH